MSLPLANPRKAPQILINILSREGSALLGRLRRVHTRLINESLSWLDLGWPSTAVTGHLQWCTSLWLLDTRRSPTNEPREMWAPYGFRTDFEMAEEGWGSSSERISPAGRERAPRIRVGEGPIGLAFQTGEVFCEEFPAAFAQSASGKEGGTRFETPDMRRGSTIALPLLAALPLDDPERDREGYECHVMGVLCIDELSTQGVLFTQSGIIERGAGQFLQDALYLAKCLAALPWGQVHVEPGAELATWPGVRRLDTTAMSELVQRKMEEILNESNDLHELARQIIDLVDSSGDDGRKELLRILEHDLEFFYWINHYPHRHGLILAAEVIEFRDEGERRRLGKLLADLVRMRLPPERERLSLVSESLGIESKDLEEVLMSALRKATSLATFEDYPETLKLLGNLIGRQPPLPSRIQQTAAQCVQNLWWASPPREEVGREVAAWLCDLLSKRTIETLRTDRVLASDERASLAMNFVHALGMLGDERFRDRTDLVVREVPYLKRLLLPRLRLALERWEISDRLGSPASQRLRDVVNYLENST